MADLDQQELLSMLMAHGEQFLQSFPSSTTSFVSKKRKRSDLDSSNQNSSQKEEEEDEWLGIDSDAQSDNMQSSDSEHCPEMRDSASSTNTRTSNVVVFSDPSSSKRPDSNPNLHMKSFMSSKISKITSECAIFGKNGKSEVDEDEEDSRTNVQNDAILHKLIYTNLLSGSLNTELDLTPAQRKKALAGRVLELTGSAKLGKGEKLAREMEKNKAAKRIREGIAGKQKERERRELEEAKNLGNYHPTLKKLYEASTSKTSSERRKRGLGMGVGKFSGGYLKLSREDIQKVGGLSSANSKTRGKGGKSREPK